MLTILCYHHSNGVTKGVYFCFSNCYCSHCVEVCQQYIQWSFSWNCVMKIYNKLRLTRDWKKVRGSQHFGTLIHYLLVNSLEILNPKPRTSNRGGELNKVDTEMDWAKIRCRSITEQTVNKFININFAQKCYM